MTPSKPVGTGATRLKFDNKPAIGPTDDAKKKNPCPLRATTTLSFLQREVDSAIALVCGKEKGDAFRRVIARQGSLSETPMRIIHQMKNVEVFTDIH